MIARAKASKMPTADTRIRIRRCMKSEYAAWLSSVATPSSSSYRSDRSKNLVFFPRNRFNVSMRAGWQSTATTARAAIDTAKEAVGRSVIEEFERAAGNYLLMEREASALTSRLQLSNFGAAFQHGGVHNEAIEKFQGMSLIYSDGACCLLQAVSIRSDQ